MKKILTALLALVMTVLLCACGSGSIVGKWAFGVNTYEFKDDNTVSISLNGALNYDGTYEVDGDKITVTVSGMLGEKTEELTYTLKGDTLTLTGDVTMTGGADVTLEFAKVKD